MYFCVAGIPSYLLANSIIFSMTDKQWPDGSFLIQTM